MNEEARWDIEWGWIEEGWGEGVCIYGHLATAYQKGLDVTKMKEGQEDFAFLGFFVLGSGYTLYG